MLKINLLNGESLTTYKKHFENIPQIGNIDQDEITLKMTKKTLNGFLDKLCFGVLDEKDFDLFNTFVINVQGTVFELTFEEISKFEYLKSQFLDFKIDNVFLDMNDEKFKHCIEQSYCNFENVREDCVCELLYLSPNIQHKSFEPSENTKHYDSDVILKPFFGKTKDNDCYLYGNPQITMHKLVYRRLCQYTSAIDELQPIEKEGLKYIFQFKKKFLSYPIIKITIFPNIPLNCKKIFWKEHANIINKIDIYYGNNFLTSVDGMAIVMYNILHNIELNFEKPNTFLIPFQLFLNGNPTIINIYENLLTFHIYFNNPYDFLICDMFDGVCKISDFMENMEFEASIIENSYLLTTEEKNKFIQVGHEYLTNDFLIFSQENNKSEYSDFVINDLKNIVYGFSVCVMDNGVLLNPEKYVEKIELLVDDLVYFSISVDIVNAFNRINLNDLGKIPFDKILWYGFNVKHIDQHQPDITLNLRNYEKVVFRVCWKEKIDCNVYLNLGVKNVYVFRDEIVRIEKNKQHLNITFE